MSCNSFDNHCKICGETIPAVEQLCPQCAKMWAVSAKSTERVFIEINTNAVPSEIMARTMLALIERYCKQYGKTITKRANGGYDIVGANEETFIAVPPVIPNELAAQIISEIAKKEYGKRGFRNGLY